MQIQKSRKRKPRGVSVSLHSNYGNFGFTWPYCLYVGAHLGKPRTGGPKSEIKQSSHAEPARAAKTEDYARQDLKAGAVRRRFLE
jgi:hypothetical protein